MKIFYFSTAKIPSKTANSVHVMKMCHALAKQNVEVTLFGLNSRDTNEVKIYDYYGVHQNFNLVRRNNKIRGISHYINGLKSRYHVQRNSKYTVLFGRDIYSIFLCRNIGVKYIYEAHALPSTKFHEFMEKKILKSQNFLKLVVISESLKKDYLKTFIALSEENIAVLPDGADIPLICKPYIELKKEPNKINVGYVGHLYKGRGIEIIVKLAIRFPENMFHIIGGTERDISEWKNKCIGIKNLVFHGFVPNGKLDDLYVNIDILLAPYQKKVSVAGDKGDTSKWMSPMKIFEYMSHRKVIIASDLPVLREILKNNENSLLCEPDNIEIWESALSRALNDNNLRCSLASRAFEDIKNKYTWEIRAKEIKRIMMEIV